MKPNRLTQSICLLLTLLPLDAWPVYDLLAVDLKPTAQDLQFCFKPDNYRTFGHTYLAAQAGGHFYFLTPAATGGFDLHAWTGDTEPPPFVEDSQKGIPICLGPFPKDSLQGISVYAGVGATLADLLENQHYAKIFDGVVTLPQPVKEWTVMVYMVGSSLESGNNHWASQDILEMLAGTNQATTDNVNLVLATGGSRRYGWETVKRSLVHQGQLSVIEDLGSQPLANSQTMSEFIRWATTQFPAHHYALILWNHGGGTQGYGQDNSPAGKGHIMDLTELAQAYQTIETPLEIVIYDACLMAAIEVAEITATAAKAMAGSVELEPGHGLDYAHLLSHLSLSPPTDGIAFGQLVQDGYIHQAKEKGSFDTKQVTYSVFDLSQLSSFHEAFDKFAREFDQVLKDRAFLTYDMLSRGIIRAPGYPYKATGKFLRALDNKHIRIDLYNILQTVSPDFSQLKTDADALLAQLDQLVVAYEANENVKTIDPQAGRVTLNIGSDSSYLTVLPDTYTVLHDSLAYYNQLKADNLSEPNRDKTCYAGLICGTNRWLGLFAKEVAGIDGYYGQQTGEFADIYLVKSLFRYPNYPEDPSIGVKGQEACQYRLCVEETQCENITVTERLLPAQRWQLLAEVQVNQSPAVLTFCGDTSNQENWSICGMAQQTEEVWGRDESLSPGDKVKPATLHFQTGETEVKQSWGKELTVGDTSAPVLKKTCDAAQAAILVAYWGLNEKRKVETLCNNQGSSNCFCPAGDTDTGCVKLGVKAGVYLKP